jgi:hypothetical protein
LIKLGQSGRGFIVWPVLPDTTRPFPIEREEKETREMERPPVYPVFSRFRFFDEIRLIFDKNRTSLIIVDES